jgi:hypothetical protein
VIRNLVIEIEATEPTIGQVQLDLLAQLPLKADTVAVADNEHPDHQLGINRRPTNLAVEGFQLVAKLSQYPRHDRIDAPQEMPHRNVPFEVEEVEQLALINPLPTHHHPLPSLKASRRRNHDSSIFRRTFSTASTHSGSRRARAPPPHAKGPPGRRRTGDTLGPRVENSTPFRDIGMAAWAVVV